MKKKKTNKKETYSLNLKEVIIFIKMVHKITVSTPEFYKHTITWCQNNHCMIPIL